MNSTALQPIGMALSAFQFSMTGTLFVGGLNHKDCWLPNSSGGSHWGTKYEATSGTLKDIGRQYNTLLNECAKRAEGAHHVQTRWGDANISISNNKRRAVWVNVPHVDERVGDSIDIYMGYERGKPLDAELRYRADRDEFSIRQFQRAGSKKIRATALSMGGKFLKAVGMKPAASGNEAWANALASLQNGKVTPMTAFYMASMISKRTNSNRLLYSLWNTEFKRGRCYNSGMIIVDGQLRPPIDVKPDYQWSSNDYFYAQINRTVRGGYDCKLFHLHESAISWRGIPKEMVRYVPGCSNAYADYPVINIVHNASIHPQHFVTDLIEGAVKMLPDTFPLAR